MIVTVNGCDVTEDIRNPKVTDNARYIASNCDIRAKLICMQRRIALRNKRIVTEGRDQGTVAFADADIKIFLTADPAERAKPLSDLGWRDVPVVRLGVAGTATEAAVPAAAEHIRNPKSNAPFSHQRPDMRRRR